MTNIHNKLKSMGMELPVLNPPLASYVPYVIHEKTLYISGQLPVKDGQIITGTLGQDLNIEQGQEAARYCALGLLAAVDHALGGKWEKFDRILRLNAFVQSSPDFKDHPQVVNGASDLMLQVLGDAGKHSRIALGAASLPKNAAVEIDAIIGLK